MDEAKRGRLQFSVRTLLLVTAAVALGTRLNALWMLSTAGVLGAAGFL